MLRTLVFTAAAADPDWPKSMNDAVGCTLGSLV